MEVWQDGSRVGLGKLLEVDLEQGSVFVYEPEALRTSHTCSLREYCEENALRLPEFAFYEVELAAARNTFAEVASAHQTLDLLSTAHSLRNLHGGDAYGYQLSEQYDRSSDSYVLEQYCYIGEGRYADTLSVSLKDGTAYVESSWGSQTYWDRWVYPAQGEPHYAGTVPDDFRMPPSWAVERGLEASREVQMEL